MIVSELVEKLQKLPQNKSLLCQVVGVDAGNVAWSMQFDVHDIPCTSFVQVRVSHPNLKELPPIDFGSGRPYPPLFGNVASER